jgi:hypothetical protein
MIMRLALRPRGDRIAIFLLHLVCFWHLTDIKHALIDV